MRSAGLGYAAPGTVIAIGVMLPFAWIDRSVDAWAREWLGVSTGLLLSGTLTALLFAYCARFLPVALHSVEAGLSRIRPSMDDAARSLGTTPRAGAVAGASPDAARQSVDRRCCWCSWMCSRNCRRP